MKLGPRRLTNSVVKEGLQSESEQHCAVEIRVLIRYVALLLRAEVIL